MKSEGASPILAAVPPAPAEPGRLPSPALFDVADAQRLPALVAELRRLGASSIAVRWPEKDLGNRAFLLVDSPPFHSVLRGEPPVYSEQAPQVWVEIGWRHPQVESIEPPAGRIVLLRPSGRCEFVPDGPFESAPEIFPLPERPVAADGEADLRLPVAVSLVADSSTESAELWVLRREPLEQLRALAEQSDDRELARLSVAVGVHEGKRIAVLRARRGPPPVLVRSEEHTSELQSRQYLVCRLLL